MKVCRLRCRPTNLFEVFQPIDESSASDSDISVDSDPNDPVFVPECLKSPETSISVGKDVCRPRSGTKGKGKASTTRTAMPTPSTSAATSSSRSRYKSHETLVHTTVNMLPHRAKSIHYKTGLSNQRPAGHFWPSMFFKMARAPVNWNSMNIYGPNSLYWLFLVSFMQYIIYNTHPKKGTHI